MTHVGETKEALVKELAELRKRLTELEQREADRQGSLSELQRSEARYRGLVEQISAIFFIAAPRPSDTAIVYISPQVADILGYTPDDFAADSELWRKTLHPEDRQRVLTESERLKSTGEPLRSEYRMVSRDGRVVWLREESVLVRERPGEALYVQGILFDISHRKAAEAAMSRRDAILEAVSFAAAQLLEAAPGQDRILEILNKLGQATEVSRVYIFENHHAEGGALLTSQRYEWVAPGIAPQLDNPELQGLEWHAAGFSRWGDVLSRGEAIHGLTREFPESEQELLTAQDILSIVIAPVFVGKTWWGLIGYDECRVEREWSAAEIEALKAAADILGAGIQRKQAEAALQTSEAFNRTLLANMADRVFAKDLNRRYILQNKASCDFWGIPYGSAIGKTDWEIHDTRTAKMITASDRVVLDTGEPYCVEERILTRDGQEQVLSVVKTPLRDNAGTMIGLVGISRDITHIRQAEEALKASEARYRAIVEDQTELVCRILADGRLSFVNGAYCRYFSNKREELVGRAYFHSIADADRISVMQRIASISADNPVVTYEHRVGTAACAEICWLQWSARGIFDDADMVVEVQAVGRDVTLRKRAEEELDRHREQLEDLVEKRTSELKSANAKLMLEIQERRRVGESLKESEKLSNAILNSLLAHITVLDRDGRIIASNRAANLFAESNRGRGLAVSGVGRDYFDACSQSIAPEQQEAALDVLGGIREVLDRSKRHFELEYLCVSDTGKRWFMIRVSPLEGKGGGVVISQIDITGRKQAEEALAGERERLAVTLRSIGDGVITTDTLGRVVSINRVAEALTGWDECEAIGQPLAEVFRIFNESTRIRSEDPVGKVVATGKTVGLADNTVLIGRNGDERIITDSASPICSKDGEIIGAVLVFRDNTAKRKIQEELLRAQKLESIGVLAGGIAHDFNNILTAIMGNISLAKLYSRPGDKISEILEQAEKSSIRAKDLTQQLLTFSRGGAPLKKPVSVARLIKESAGFALSGSNVGCKFSLPDDLWPVEVDEGQIHQVLNNVIINADQAMPEGGSIKICAENVVLGASHKLPVRPGRFVKISIEDHGTGIKREHLPKIFDPYFTTKQKGNGLGLATAYSILKKHEGLITVQSDLGLGTTFHMYLPVSHREPPEPQVQLQEAISGKGKVLVMDDEKVVRDVAGQMLQHLGYQVKVAEDGAKAIEVYVKDTDAGEPFDVVIMDLTVPGGMGGLEAISKLRQIDPGIKAIVSSGYSNDEVMANFRAYGFKGIIAKPYKIREVSEVVQEVIKGEGE